MDVFNKRFNQIIAESEMTGAEISKALGIHPPTLSKYIHGKSGMSTETLYKVCKTFNVSANWLLGLSSEKELNPYSTKDLEVLRTREGLHGVAARPAPRKKYGIKK